MYDLYTCDIYGQAADLSKMDHIFHCKYYSGDRSKTEPIFVIDKDNLSRQSVSRIEETTQIFNKYHEAREIERLYVSPADYKLARANLSAKADP